MGQRVYPPKVCVLNRDEKHFKKHSTLFATGITPETIKRDYILVTTNPTGIPPYEQIPTAAVTWGWNSG